MISAHPTRGEKSRLKNTWQRLLKYSSFVTSRSSRCAAVCPRCAASCSLMPPRTMSPTVEATNNLYALGLPLWLQALTLSVIPLKWASADAQNIPGAPAESRIRRSGSVPSNRFTTKRLRRDLEEKGTNGDSDQRPPAGQLTALILHNVSPTLFHARRRCGEQQHPTFNVTSERRERVTGRVGGGGWVKAPSNCLGALRKRTPYLCRCPPPCSDTWLVT